MKKLLLIAVLLLSQYAIGQTAAISNWCVTGATHAFLAGLPSTNYVQGVIPKCSVTVYLTGTTTKATIYADGSDTPLSNPFTADTKGKWLLYAVTGVGYDVVMSGGIPPNTYLAPVTITDVFAGGSGGGGGGFIAGGDLSGSSTSQQVIGIEGNAIPSLTSGYLHWNGSAWVFDTPGGSGIPGVVYATSFSNIQGCITAAGTTGACLIPPTYSGGDSFTNPNNITVIDWRAGTQSFLNPRAWGALVAGTSNDDTAAWRSMIAYAEALPTCLNGTGLQCAALYVPPGYSTAGCASPISIQNPGISLTGAGRETSFLGPNGVVSGCSGWFGSWLAVTGTVAQYVSGGVMNYNGAPLLSGGGNSLQQQSITSNNAFVNVSDCPVCAALNGLTQFTVEFWFRPTSITGQQLSSSSGQLGSTDTVHHAYDVYMDAGGHITFLLNVGGTTATITDGTHALFPSTTYHIAGTYDGSTVRLFINGAVAGTPVSASGSVQQKQYESVHIGCDAASDLYDGCGGSGTFEQYGFNGLVDGFRLSNVARYTSTFTPRTSKWPTPDANTLVQFNFQTQFDSIWTQGGNAAVGAPILVNFPIHRNDFCPGGAQTTKITGVGFPLGNEYINSGIGVTLKDIGVGRIAMNNNGLMIGRGCNFDSSVEDFWSAGATVNNRYSFYDGTGIAHFEKFSLNGGPYQFVGPANGAARDFFITMDANSVEPVIFQGLSGGPSNLLTIDNFQYDSETGAGNLVTPLLFDNIQQAIVMGSFLTNANGPTSSYPVIVEAPLKRTNITFVANSFTTNAGSAARIHLAENTSPQSFPSIPNPAILIGDFESLTASSGVPWTDGLAQGLDNKFWSYGAVPYTFNLLNDGATGTYPTLGVKVTSAGKGVATTTSDTAGIVGVAVPLDQQQNLSTFLTSGSVNVAYAGEAKLTFDGAATAGHYVQRSSTEGGAFSDAGATIPTSGEIIGTVVTAAAVITPPPAPPCSPVTSGGSMADGTYRVAATIANIASGETVIGSEQIVTITGGGGAGEINCSALGSILPSAKWPDGSAGFGMYVTAAGGGTGTETKQTVNTSTCTGTFGVATVANSGSFCGLNSGYLLKSLVAGAAVPSSNTAGGWATVLLSLQTPGSGGGSGTLTSVATTSPIAGGTITTTGTITCPTCVTSASSLTSTAIMTGAGSQGSQTPNVSATMDSSGNIATPGSISAGVGTGVAGRLAVGQGTIPSLLANGFSMFGPTAIATGYGWQMPTAENSSDGVLLVPAASSHVSLPVVGLLPLTDMATQGADTFVGNATGSTAKPTAVSMPSCAADGSHALTYPSHVLTCTSISGGSTPTVLYWANNVTIGTSQGTPTQNHTYCWGPYQQAANITYSEASVYIQTASTGGGNTDFGFYTLNGITPSVSVATLNGHWGAKAGGALTGGQNNNFTVSGAPKTINSATWYLACVTSSDTASWTLLGIGSPNATLFYNGSDMSSTTSGGVLATSFTLPTSPTAWAAGRDVNVAAIP